MTFFWLVFLLSKQTCGLKILSRFWTKKCTKQKLTSSFLSDIVLSIFQRWGTKYWHQNSFCAECWIFHSLQYFSDFSYFYKKALRHYYFLFEWGWHLNVNALIMKRGFVVFCLPSCLWSVEQNLLKEWEDVTEIALKKYRSS